MAIPEDTVKKALFPLLFILFILDIVKHYL